MKGTLKIARKDFLQQFYNKRFYLVGSLLLATMILGAVLFPWISYQGFTDQTDPSSEEYNTERALFHPAVSFAAYLSIPLLGGVAFLQLLSIVLTSDSVSGEWQSRTIFLLLTKSVSRSGFVVGKFLGAFALLSLFTTVLALGVFLVLHPLFDFSLTWEVLGHFSLALVVLLLGVAAFTAFSVFVSSMMRSPVLSLLTVVFAWLLVFPLLGMTGFLVAVTDDDFRRLGHFDHDAALADCGPDPRFDTYDPETDTFQDPSQEEVASWEGCWQTWQQKVEDWYGERGLWEYDHQAALEACATMQTNESAEGDSADSCTEQAEEDLAAYEEKRHEILMSKWDSPRVDWSRYLSPSAAMTASPEILHDDVDAVGAFGLFFEGYDDTPVHAWGAAMALVLQTLVFLGLSSWNLKRKDFD